MESKYKINKQTFIGLIVYPIILILLCITYVKQYGFGWFEFICALLGHYVTNISVGVGLHRLWSHGAFKTNKVVEFILCLLTTGALQGPAIAWSSDHYKHHTYTDTDLDPHSPKRFSNKFLGFLWSHIGWMLVKDYNNKHIDRITMKKLGNNKILLWQLRHYWSILIFMHSIPPFLLGYLWKGTFFAGYASFLFVGIGRCFQQHMTFCVNSVCHFWGSRKYTNGTARDIWWLAPLLLGENWHNFHHAFPKDYRNGVKWYHFDLHKWIIYVMEKVGLAWDLDRTPEFRIRAKEVETANQLLDEVKIEWRTIYNRYESLKSKMRSKLAELESYSPDLKNTIINNLDDLSHKVDSLISEVKLFMESPEVSSNRVLKAAYENFTQLQMKFDHIVQRLSVA